MVSVHSPEFDHEKERAVVERAAAKYGLDQPIYMDNDHAFWKGLRNRYWPSFYLVDHEGNVRVRRYGEMHADTSRARAFEAMIKELLAAAKAG